ncbi:unnamed protein product, partial [Hapterophycus canaliculatus]
QQQQRQGVEKILDLCCGSGVQGIAAAVLRRGQASVTCVDISRRAVRFSRFNALLNGLTLDAGSRSESGPDEERKGFRAVVGDLYVPLASPAVGGHAAALVPCGALGAPLSGKDYRSSGGGGYEKSEGGDAPAAAAAAAAGTRTTATTATSNPQPPPPPASGHYDLILANPPFVPVPPRLGAVRRRYDLFASGGASGEAVIERILRGAVDRLRPGGGVLAVVTELANPRTFDAKLRRWAGGAVAPDGDWVEEGDSDAGDGDGRRDDRDRGGSASIPVWSGVVLHEQQPWTAREYAARRAGSPGEVEGWERHLRMVVGIEEMSAGFIFVRRGGGADVDNGGGGGGGGGKVEVRGVEKLWAPHNGEAIEHTKLVLDTM